MDFMIGFTDVLAAAVSGSGHGGHGATAGLTSLWSAEALIALITLAALEIVLGIDNIVFIAILAGKLPPHQQNSARQI
ncbi:MAG: hypothetical protein NZ561_12645, partial [Phycisphaerae bacterium]|nr:hypothetical protein [Phycisphaerae bacterium]